jgi:hypothetical protein
MQHKGRKQLKPDVPVVEGHMPHVESMTGLKVSLKSKIETPGMI